MIEKRYLKEEESTSSSMVSLEVLFCTVMVDTNEGHDLATFNVPGSYLHVDIPKDKKNLMNLSFFLT